MTSTQRDRAAANWRAEQAAKAAQSWAAEARSHAERALAATVDGRTTAAHNSARAAAVCAEKAKQEAAKVVDDLNTEATEKRAEIVRSLAPYVARATKATFTPDSWCIDALAQWVNDVAPEVDLNQWLSDAGWPNEE